MDQSSSKPTIKLADFGDAVQLNTTYYIHQLLGNPEFAAPEIILGNPVSLTSDVWSIGVLTYVLLSGVSPFLDESVEETCLNICRLDFSFPDDYFKGVSQKAKDFVCFLLQDDPAKRPSAALTLQEQWLQLGNSKGADSIDISRLTSFIERRKHQNDVRPIRSIKNFLQSRLLPRVWSCLKFSLILFHLPIRLEIDSSCQSIRLEIRLLLPISCWLEFWGKQTRSQPAASECSCASAFHRDHARLRVGLAMQTSLGWRTIALYSAKSSREWHSNSILFRFLQKKNKIVFLINKSWILQVNLTTVFKIYSRKKCLCSKHWC